MQLSAQRKVSYAVLLVLIAAGVGCWIYQLGHGLGVTGMSNAVSWGTYIMMFMLFVGLSAGGLIVASSAHVFNIERFKKVALPAVICSTVCICCAGMFILIDLGGVQRVWRMLASPNFSSPLMWDMCVITLYLVINILDIVWLATGQERKVQILSRIALPTAILVHSVTAWIFGLQIAREGWNSAIMAPIFVASACDSGLALLIVSLIGLEKAKIFETGKELIASLSGLLATFIAVDAFFIGCELLTVAYAGTESGNALLSVMTSGSTAPYFWFEIICGLLIPFCILVFAKNRQRTGLVVFSSILVILGVMCKRIWLLFSSFVTPNVQGGPGITLGTTAAQTAGPDMWTLLGAYAPTGLEIAVVIGVVSVGILGFLVLSDKLIKCGEAK